MSMFSDLRHVPSYQASFRDFSVLDEEGALLPWPAFEVMIERSLRMLHGVHLPISLFAIGSPRAARGGASGQMARSGASGTIAEILGPLGTIGKLADARLGFLFLGPHGATGRAELTQYLRQRIGVRLRQSGWLDTARTLELAVGHGWTDQVEDAEELFQLLAADTGTM